MLRRNLNFITKLFSGLLFTAIVVGNAQAAVFSFTENYSLLGDSSYGPSDTSFLNVPDSANLFSLPQFDPALGALQSVTFSITGDLTFQADIISTDVIDDSLVNEANADFLVGVGIGAFINSTFTLTTDSLYAESISCGGAPNSFECSNSTGNSLPIMTSQIFTGNDMNDFIGTGNLGNAQLQLLAGLDSMNLDNLNDASLNINGLNFEGDVTVEYTTSAVPIPAAVWLFGSAMIGLVGLTRKKV